MDRCLYLSEACRQGEGKGAGDWGGGMRGDNMIRLVQHLWYEDQLGHKTVGQTYASAISYAGEGGGRRRGGRCACICASV